MTSVVIAAHNEAAVLGRTLDRLTQGATDASLDIVVVANGCTDSTAEAARAFPGVRVLELAEPGKAQALNAGDAIAHGYPRVYLDADIAVDASGLRKLARALDRGPALAAAPQRRVELTGRPLAVRGYYAIHSRLPAIRDGLFGRGMVALSERGRSRFDRFPDLLADDLFLDSLFSKEERVVVREVISVVEAPRRTRDLVRRLERVRRGNRQLRRSHAVEPPSNVAATLRPEAHWDWLTHVVLPRPWLAPAAVAYVALTGIADVGARRASAGGWGRDDSTRVTSSHESRGVLGGG